MRARSCVCLTGADSRHLGPSTNNGSVSLFAIKTVKRSRVFYFEDEPGRRSAAQSLPHEKLLPRDEARQIAVRMAKLPELLRK